MDPNSQYVFKSSKMRMKLGKYVDVQSAHYLNKEYRFLTVNIGVLMNL